MTIANGATPDLAGNLTNANVSTGAITYYIDKWAGSSEWQEYKGGGLFNAGNRKIKVVQAADENYEEGVTEFTVTVQAANNGDSSQTYTVSGTVQTAEFEIESSNGKYNVKYNGNTILTGINELTVKATSTGNFWLRSGDYQGYSSQQYGNAWSGSITLSSSDLATAAEHSPLVATNNGYGDITSLILEGK